MCVYVMYMLSTYVTSKKWMRSSKKVSCRKGQKVQSNGEYSDLEVDGKRKIFRTKKADRKKESRIGNFKGGSVRQHCHRCKVILEKSDILKF